jgi:hypothetical protein
LPHKSNFPFCPRAQECPQPDADFRAQQCSEFNEKSFRGQTYQWEPYIKGKRRAKCQDSPHGSLGILVDDAECELNCRPVNQKYFARLRETAVDGTHCLKIHNPPKNNASFDRGVCVEGKCKVSGLHEEIDAEIKSLHSSQSVKLLRAENLSRSFLFHGERLKLIKILAYTSLH